MSSHYDEIPNKKLIKLVIHRKLMAEEIARNSHRKQLIKALMKDENQK